jgi:hypothetical protein
LSIRATEGAGPPWGTTGELEPEPKRRTPLLIVAALIVGLIVLLGVLAATGVVPVPWAPKTVTEGDPVFGWTLTFPKAWNTKPQTPTTTTVRFQSNSGNGIGVRVQAQRFPQEIPADQVRSDTVVNQLKNLVNRRANDVTIVDGPTFGTIHGVPYTRYVYTYSVSLNGVPRTVEDDDYYFINGAKLEEVTFEALATKWAKTLPQFDKAIATFRSQHLSVGGVTSTATTAPSVSPGH